MVAPPARTTASYSAAQLLGGQVVLARAADLDAGDEPGALGAHLVQPPVEDGLLHLELGDAVAEQPADAVGPLVDGDVVPGPGELLGGGQAGRARSRRRRPSCRSARAGVCGCTQPSSKARSMISHSICLIVTGDSCRFSTQEPSHGAGHSFPVNSGKLFVECSRSIASLPVVAAGEVVPLRDQVGHRAGVVAERDAAVHAAGGLLAHRGDREDRVLAVLAGEVDVLPVHDPDVDRTARRQLPLVLQESGGVSHERLLLRVLRETSGLRSASQPRAASITARSTSFRWPRPSAAPRARAGSRAA